MADIKKEDPVNRQISERTSYFDHMLTVSQRYINRLIILAAIINLLLLIPDMTFLESSPAKIGVAIVRVVYSASLFAVRIKCSALTTFKRLSFIVSFCEAVAAAIFLFVFSMYPSPNFMIQAMGAIVLIIIIFVIPNRWANILYIVLAGSVGFFVCALIFVRPININELAAAAAYISVTIFLCAISARNSERHQLNEFMARNELERISMTDYLTDTANRLKMSQEAERWISFCSGHSQPLSLVFSDVDNLKLINDRYGHAAGDIVLSNLARLIQNQLRNSDILARWGGDEFIILLPNVSLDNAIALAKRIERSVRESLIIENDRVTCSFGVVEMKDSSTFETLVREADSLMYEAKNHRKDVVLFNR